MSIVKSIQFYEVKQFPVSKHCNINRHTSTRCLFELIPSTAKFVQNFSNIFEKRRKNNTCYNTVDRVISQSM